MDAQEKNGEVICLAAGDLGLTKNMFRYAGKIAKITMEKEGADCYELDIDNKESWWQDWMFDPDYHPENDPLSAARYRDLRRRNEVF
jgi:hypothetical protein